MVLKAIKYSTKRRKKMAFGVALLVASLCFYSFRLLKRLSDGGPEADLSLVIVQATNAAVLFIAIMFGTFFLRRFIRYDQALTSDGEDVVAVDYLGRIRRYTSKNVVYRLTKRSLKLSENDKATLTILLADLHPEDAAGLRERSGD